MNSEEKREQLLKRALPGLAITIIYFVFISGMMSEKMKKAETDYQALISSGVSADALPGVENQQDQVLQQLSELEKKVAAQRAQFKKIAGFLSNNGASSNAVMGKLAKILDENLVKIRKDAKEELPEDKLSLALKEVWKAVKPAEAVAKEAVAKKTPSVATTAEKPVGSIISVHHLWLKGSYGAMYQALAAIADPKLQVLPVSLVMQMPELDSDNSGEMEWELILWM